MSKQQDDKIQNSVLGDEATIWYGPHQCEACGEWIVRAELARGGEKFDPPAHLFRVFQRGAESGNPAVAYPAVWKPHVCKPAGLYKTPDEAAR